MIRIKIAHHRCPGDSLVLTAAIRSLHMNYPGEYLVGVDCTAPELFDGNPDVVKLDWPFQWAEIDYQDGLNSANSTNIHMMAAMCGGLEKVVGRPVPLQVDRPVLVLSEPEKQWSGVLLEIAPEPVPYVVLNAGHKRDVPVKGIGRTIAQAVVDHFADKIRFVQIGTATEVHPELSGVVNLIGKTSIRELARVVHHATAGVGPVTFLGHVAAALKKPYVCVVGGREPAAWIAYKETTVLSTVGELDCCRDRACWKTHLEPVDHPHTRLCSLPVIQPGGETVAGCISRIGAGGIISALEGMI